MDMIKDHSNEEFNSYMKGLEGWIIGYEDKIKFRSYISENGYLYDGHEVDVDGIRRFLFEREINNL